VQTCCLVFLFTLCLCVPAMSFAQSPRIRTWLCYYGTAFGPEVYSRFDLVVLDGQYHPPLVRRGKGRPILLGYVSVGELEEGGHLWARTTQRPYLVRKNEQWNSWVVDVRHPLWQSFLFEKAIPSVVERGFDGLFLDTVDSSLDLLRGAEGEKFQGTEAALQEIITRIKKEFPGKFVGLNRGLPIVSKVAGSVDFVVVEDLYSYYSGPEKGYVRVPQETQTLLLRQVDEILRLKPRPVILTLDYAGAGQADLAREAVSFSRNKGWIPYVSTYKLDEIFFYTFDD